VNAREVTTKVVLPAEGPATVAVRASVGFGPVRIMGGHVRLKIECSGESASTFGTLVFAARVQLLVVKNSRRGNQRSGGNVHGRDGRMNTVPEFHRKELVSANRGTASGIVGKTRRVDKGPGFVDLLGRDWAPRRRRWQRTKRRGIICIVQVAQGNAATIFRASSGMDLVEVHV
jgi:hypothetical protein